MSEVEIMPNLDGITGYFDISSVDLTNNKWINIAETNLVDKHDMDLPNGGTIQNNALYLTAEQYGQLQMSTEPQTIYCVFKVISPTGQWTPIAGKKTTSTSSYYALSLHCNTSNNIAVVVQGRELNSSISASDYHVACITRNNTTAYLYIDGVKIGTITAYTGNYGGYCYINRYYRSGFMHTPTDVEFRMCAFGTIYHDENTVKTNTAFLMNGDKTKYLRLAGTDSVAIAYAIARNQESAAALQELKKAYREGTVNGDNGNDDVTEPYETTDPDEPAKFPHDPNNDGGDGTVNTDDGITDFKNGYWFACSNTPSGELYLYVKLWIEPYYEQSSSGSSRYKNKIWATIYDRDGTEQSTIYCGYQYSWSTLSGREETAVSASISGNALLIKRFVHYISGSSEDFYQSEVIGLTGSVNLYVIKSGNVSPF